MLDSVNFVATFDNMIYERFAVFQKLLVVSDSYFASFRTYSVQSCRHMEVNSQAIADLCVTLGFSWPKAVACSNIMLFILNIGLGHWIAQSLYCTLKREREIEKERNASAQIQFFPNLRSESEKLSNTERTGQVPW